MPKAQRRIEKSLTLKTLSFSGCIERRISLAIEIVGLGHLLFPIGSLEQAAERVGALQRLSAADGCRCYRRSPHPARR